MRLLLKYISLVTILFIVVFTLCNFLFPLNTTSIYRPSSKIVYSKTNEILNLDLSADGYFRINNGLDKIPPAYITKLLDFEDRYFYSHLGINPFSIVRAVLHNITSSNRIGASTITMQLARMIEKRDRSYSSKIIECFRALQLELYLSKREILSAYLNMAPYGGNIEGIHSASLLYFDKKVANLSLAEFAYLMIIPKNPEVYKPSKNMRKAIFRRNMFYKTLLDSKRISLQKFKYLVGENIVASRKARPQLLPHFARFKKNSTITYTNINMGLQKLLQKNMKLIVANNYDSGIRNGACIIYDLHKEKVVVWLGSQDFWDDASLGQNDGILAKRSPGSLLKPFIYAQAIDEGLITPKQLVLDIPMQFGEYSPRNFDKKYYGLISAHEALTLSLNIPAIDLNIALNYDLFDLINSAIPKGLAHNKKHYNQGIVLGGVGLSLLDLVKLYSMFPNKGVAIGNKNSTISANSSFLVSKILEDNFRSNFSSYWDSMKNPTQYSFKTGTSAQSRDLWTIAFNDRFIVGSWYGDFKGASSKDTSGLSIASQTVALAMAQLTKRYGEFPLKNVSSVIQAKTCQDSTFRVQGDCTNTVDDEWLSETNISSQCNSLTLQKVSYLQKQGLMPTLKASNCWDKVKTLQPKIMSPLNQSKIVISSNIPLQYQKTKLLCIAANNKSMVHWFVDSKQIKSTSSGVSIFHNFSPGKHEIMCVDESSLFSKIEIEVTN